MCCRADLQNINALRLRRRALIFRDSALQQHVLISDNSRVRKIIS